MNDFSHPTSMHDPYAIRLYFGDLKVFVDFTIRQNQIF